RRPRGSDLTLASVAYGSLATRKVDLFHAARPGAWEYSAYATYLGANSDFHYRNANGTTENPSDDCRATRQNNDFDGVDVDGRVRKHGDRGDFRMGGHVTWKDQGIAGTAAAPTPHADLDTLRVTLDGGAERQALGWSSVRGRVGAFARAE